MIAGSSGAMSRHNVLTCMDSLTSTSKILAAAIWTHVLRVDRDLLNVQAGHRKADLKRGDEVGFEMAGRHVISKEFLKSHT